ncbi:glutamine amidotransferase [Dehalococcoides mccartyi]|jgi:5'-phosphate synthase pdxT subunit|uniref:Pyridoxal 5'-phosphate synthase subunit PdxT n=2 Tax=Dehalococcoides mccartyi TaxID=61435 RepID=PDXT_DEHMC|nr:MULTISPECIES: pyridoxal 5'-phosphate synthase glutaminase subunit PdxT [Dehalococcoides]Q3ZX06.1 RecName: Full=Pyridoxal 5'-phosphate synthase subunit PdxT; AltName: Full=Pdx2; AltName: Full=Pyridoxal 5'-phosphate synthase glutaminase subunit [Dehalococcoides mccartyi CBDB1]AGG06233.1 glutamine amidotransferase subunit PdxT [Dehalococcoides mccartyi DCMB5]AGG07665.1 glutamine amidotransferase subunit PdxT [Dehalococcoides mccartyi BTF08]AII60697.1 glutamine amidotransferase [Dehalococcoides 
MKIGVLALQGAFREHLNMLGTLGAEAVEVRKAEGLPELSGLIIPGGESTTITKLLDIFGMAEPIKALAKKGMPIWGTCAGMICLAKELPGDISGVKPLGLMDITVRRNAFGRQVNSFEAMLKVKGLDEADFPAVFIRAPLVEKTGKGVEILSKLPDGTIVAVRENNLLAISFHPELSGDNRFHRYFVQMAKTYKA